jgi:hypothetical protein
VFKRLIWFTSGAASGAAGSVWVRRRIRDRLARYTPGGFKQQAVARAKKASTDAKIAIDEGRRLAQQYREESR